MVQPAEHVVYAIHDYEIPGKGFLPLKAGDVLFVEDADASGWWLGVNLRRQKGVFPSTYTLPYVFPLPSSELMHDAQLLLLARAFQVDLASGSPAPLLPLAIAESRQRALPSVSTEHLREELQQRLLEREAARKEVVDHLEQLLACQKRRHDFRQTIAAAQAARARQCEETQQELDALQDELRRGVEAVEAAKDICLAKDVVPSLAWWHLYAEVKAAAAANQETSAAAREKAWRAALKDAKSVVHSQEGRLASLSAQYANADAAFTQAAASLQSRIEWRDANVAAMLAYWAERAAAAKSAYITAKTERDAAEVASQQEAAQLRQRLEEGKAEFAKVKEEYRRLKGEAQRVSNMLKKQDALDALSNAIADVDREIAARERLQAAH